MRKYNQYVDEELVELLRTHDRKAFTALYERYWERLFHTAAHALENKEEAEECVQDIFFSLWSRRETLMLKHSIHTYLSVAVKYKVIDILNKRKKDRLHIKARLPFIDIAAPSAESNLLEKELWERLERTIELLPEKCKIVYKMSREEGKTHDQIAAELNISKKTVNNHLVRSLKDIKNTISSVIIII